MDKLKPILAHKFWILFALALLIPVIGWWKDTGTLADTIKKRQDAIKTAFTSAKVDRPVPNNDWRDKLQQINELQQHKYDESARDLWERQKMLIVWPSEIASEMASVPYRKDIPKFEREVYGSRYFTALSDMKKVVKPYDPNTGSGLVVLMDSAIKGIPADRWTDLAPESKEMWDAQEDLELWKAILKAIAEVNAEATTMADNPPVRVVHQIDLMGGSRKAAGGISAAPSDSSATTGAAGGGERGSFSLGGGGGSGGKSASSADFQLSEELVIGNPSGGEGGDAANMAGDAGATPAPKQETRYVDEDPNLPYKVRFFYLKVTMDHRSVPHLLASLTNMPYPVTIVRVQQMALFDEGTGARAVAGVGGAGPGGGAGGRPMSGVGGVPMNRPMVGGMVQTEEEKARIENARKVLETAMTDSNLAEVVIAGLMTLYQPPPESAPAAGQPATEPAPAAPVDPAGATPETPAASPPATEAKPAGTATPADASQTPGTSPSATTPAPTTPATEKPADPASPENSIPEKPAGTTPEPPKPAAGPPTSSP